MTHYRDTNHSTSLTTFLQNLGKQKQEFWWTPVYCLYIFLYGLLWSVIILFPVNSSSLSYTKPLTLRWLEGGPKPQNGISLRPELVMDVHQIYVFLSLPYDGTVLLVLTPSCESFSRDGEWPTYKNPFIGYTRSQRTRHFTLVSREWSIQQYSQFTQW